MNIRSYILETYHGNHKAPTSSNGNPLYDVSGTYPDDLYTHPNAYYFYGTGSNSSSDRKMDQESIKIIRAAKDLPNSTLEIFRAVPPDVSDNINSGDWVTINKRYAIGHGESSLEGDYKVISKKVHAKDLFTSGDSIHEWGYNPQ
jgi:hypothetical protein